MPPTTDQLGEYLVPEERLTAVYTGSLTDRSTRRPAAIGVTDRRLLCLAEDGAFLNVGYDSITAVRSHQRSTLTYRGNDSRLLLAAGGLLTGLAFAVTVALASTVLVPFLVFTAVAGIATWTSLRRGEADGELPRANEFAERIESAIRDADWFQRRVDRLDEPPDGQQLLRTGSALVAAFSFVGVVVFASSLVPVFGLFFVLGGLALCDYAHRHREAFDGIELRRRREREVSISTEDGRSVVIRSEPTDGIDRELSRMAFVEDRDPVAPVAAQSSVRSGRTQSDDVPS